jgi:hypothetical protein
MDQRELLIKQILKQRNESIIKLQKFFKIKQFQKKIRQFLLIKKILLIRKFSIQKIIDNIIEYKRYKTIKKLTNKLKNCYSISPSINNVTNILIKIFYNQKNYKKFKIYNLNFCPIRKKFVFDIPKKKFIKSNKIFRFVFLINNKIFIDKNYKCILINGIIMNTINFKEYDEKINLLNKTVYKEIIFKNILNQIYFSSDSTNCDSEEENNNNNINNNNINNDYFLLNNKNKKNYLNLSYNKKNVLNGINNNNFNNHINNNIIVNKLKSNDDINLVIKPILKRNTRKNKTVKSPKRRVSFGNIQFSY